MNDTDHPAGLSALLARASAAGTGARRLYAPGREEALGAVLDAISACIAPRRLTVSDDRGLDLSLDCSEGKVVALGNIRSPATARYDTLIGRALRMDDLDHLVGLFDELFFGDQTLSFRTTPSPEQDVEPRKGIATRDLAQALGLRSFDAFGIDPVSYLIDAAEEFLIAVFPPDAPPEFRQDDPTLPDTLGPLIDAILTNVPNLAEGELLAFETADAEGLALAVVGAASGLTILVLESDGLPDTAAFWANMRHVPLVVGTE